MMKCTHCGSSNFEKRGVVVTNETAKQRIVCNECRKWSRIDLSYKEEPNFERTPEQLAELIKPETNTYIITSAQNNTPVDTKFWKGLKQLAKHYNAQLLVIPLLYRNPTSLEEFDKDAWWPKEVLPYLVENEIRLSSGVRIMANVKIQATTVNPLTGFESVTQGDSAVFGHGQIQQRTVATPQKRLPKILTTTGSTSIKNYSKTKAGIKGDFHHSLGAAIVELDKENSLFHIRVVVGDENSEFYDLNKHVNDKRVRTISRIEALVTGDEHHWFACPEVKEATYTASDSIVNVLRPEYIARHDIIDSYSISHHHRNSPAARIGKHLNQMDSLEFELEATKAFLEETTPNFTTNVIVPSNHHDHIKRWLEECEWRNEPWNAKIYHELWLAWIKAIEAEDNFHPLTYWLKEHCKVKSLYLTNDYPFIVKGIYLGYHGHRGPDGAKGSIRNMSKIGAKTVIGHTHSPGIDKGCYQVGTSSKLKLEYTQGPSSWLNTHCIIHSNGKRQLVNITKGRWRLDR